MQCECCGSENGEADLTEHKGRMLCEDCCMDSLAPPKDCLHGGRDVGARLREKADRKRAKDES